MSLASCSREVGRLLAELGQRVVFAESCTAGLVCATLGQLPGISQYLCGSAVTYRDGSKAQWLGVPVTLLRDPGAVSASVAAEMAAGVLRLASEADWSASVTGHLGPDAPPELDGLIFVAVARRESSGGISVRGTYPCRLSSKTRKSRQREAAEQVLRCLHQALQTG